VATIHSSVNSDIYILIEGVRAVIAVSRAYRSTENGGWIDLAHNFTITTSVKQDSGMKR